LNLVIVGSVAFDTIETPAGRRDRLPGGSGTYASVAASFLPGQDWSRLSGGFPRKSLSLLRSRNIDLTGVKIKRGKSLAWHGLYASDPNQRTTLKTELNVWQDFRPVMPENYRQAEILFLSNLDPESHDYILSQMKAVKLVAMDTIRYWIETKPEALFEAIQKVDILFANDEETRLLSSEFNLVRAGA